MGLLLANKFPSFSSFFLTNISSVLVFIASHLPNKYTLPGLAEEDHQIIAGNCSPSFSPHFLLCAIFFSPFCLILLKQCCLLSTDDTVHCPICFTLLLITNYLLDCSAIKRTHQQLCNVQLAPANPPSPSAPSYVPTLGAILVLFLPLSSLELMVQTHCQHYSVVEWNGTWHWHHMPWASRVQWSSCSWGGCAARRRLLWGMARTMNASRILMVMMLIPLLMYIAT